MRHANREAPILKGCKQLLEMRRIFHFRQNTRVIRIGNRLLKFSVRGGSDIIAIVPGSGRFMAIECKAPGAKPTPEQHAFLTAVHDSGGFAIVVDDVAQLARALDDLEQDPWGS